MTTFIQALLNRSIEVQATRENCYNAQHDQFSSVQQTVTISAIINGYCRLASVELLNLLKQAGLQYWIDFKVDAFYDRLRNARCADEVIIILSELEKHLDSRINVIIKYTSNGVTK